MVALRRFDKTQTSINRVRDCFSCAISLLLCASVTPGCKGGGRPPSEEVTGAATLSSSGKVALHVSEHTLANWRYSSWARWQIDGFVSGALASDGTAFAVVTDAQIEAGQLLTGGGGLRYPIVISLANESVSDVLVDKFRSFVNAGGHAYIGSSSFTRRQDGSARGNFALSPEMGLVSRGSWQLGNDVVRVSSSGSADSLPLNAPDWHFLPLRWDITHFPPGFVSDIRTDFSQDPQPNLDFYSSRPIHEGSHWYWDALPGVTNGATVIVRPWVQPGFTNGVAPTASATPAGFSESVFATTWSPLYDVQFADVNGDGKVDAVGRHTMSGDVQVGLSTGQEFATSSSWTSFDTTYDMWLADVDGDGAADLVGRPKSGGTDVKVALSRAKQGVNAFDSPTGWTTWSQSYDLWLADVDGDGAADLVGRPKSQGTDVQVALSLAKQQNTHGFQEPSTRWTDWNQSYNLWLADVDGDGAADLVGRPKSTGADVQVALSLAKQQNTRRFQEPSAHWTDWNQTYELRLADVDGDGAADLIGHRLPGSQADHDDVQVALSTRPGFAQPSQRWGWWEQTPTTCGRAAPDCPQPPLTPGQRQYVPYIGDVNGDGRADLIGRGIASPNVIALWINKGPQTGTGTAQSTPPGYGVLTAEKTYGAGKFVYNANMQPFAGYGGDSKIVSEYQSLRSAIDTAYLTHDEALVRLSPWPYPYAAAFIYRHDHVLNHGIVQLETGFGISGEYYIEPEIKKSNNVNSTDYPDFAFADTHPPNHAIIGAHQLFHRWPDENDDPAVALQKLNDTRTMISNDTGISPINFVAPGYLALRKGSLTAIRDAQFITAGEQGFSPFPSFSVDPEVNGGDVGSVLQLPVTGIIEQQPWPEVCRGVTAVHGMNGLINTYDHAGSDAGGLITGRSDASEYLNFVFSQTSGPAECGPGLNGLNIWKTTSSDIRQWWLLRERKSLAITQSQTSTGAHITVTVSTAAQRPNTTTNADPAGVALRIRLSPRLLGFAATRSITLTGAAGPAQSAIQGDQLVVQIGTATTVDIQLGS
jgi:hypothetical protein